MVSHRDPRENARPANRGVIITQTTWSVHFEPNCRASLEVSIDFIIDHDQLSVAAVHQKGARNSYHAHTSSECYIIGNSNSLVCCSRNVCSFRIFKSMHINHNNIFSFYTQLIDSILFPNSHSLFIFSTWKERVVLLPGKWSVSFYHSLTLGDLSVLWNMVLWTSASCAMTFSSSCPLVSFCPFHLDRSFLLSDWPAPPSGDWFQNYVAVLS